MTKLVLMHKSDSIYEDDLDCVYDFPSSYLKAMREAVGDWIIYYEPVKAGPRGYFGVAKIQDVIDKPGSVGRYLAIIEPGSFLNFDKNVPRLIEGQPLEVSLQAADGSPKKGGAQQLAVRRITDEDFSKIVNIGLPVDLEEAEAVRYSLNHVEMQENRAVFDRPVVERLSRRAYRDVAFRRKVRDAYGNRCAFSGLELRNGGGRPEVQAAHIRPVSESGSDSVRNGLALSGTLHWMFDRGLISVADDATILVSRNKVPQEVVDRLIVPNGKLRLPPDPRDHPLRENLKWHRENRFGQINFDAPQDWRSK